MADEQTPAPEGELDPNASPSDGNDPNDNQPNPIEELASKMGWAPQDQFRGNADEWKPADQFILASKDINRTQARELRNLRDEVGRIARTSSQILADKIAERDSYWQGVHAQAVQEGNVEVAERATNERIKLKTEAAPQDTGEPPETREFRQRNAAWFEKDDLATVRAMEVAAQMQRLGRPPAAQLEAAERAVRKEFPELFKVQTGKPPPATQTATSRTAQTSSRTKGFNDMPPESQNMAREYERRHGIKPEDFAKSYWADQAKRERRA